MVRFKEKISRFYIFYFIVAISVVTVPFLIITFSDPANLQFLPIDLGWCLFCILVAIYRFRLIRNIELTDKFIFVPNRGYYRHPSDVRGKNQVVVGRHTNKSVFNISNSGARGKIKIVNGRLKIPYDEISEIKIQDGTFYLTYNSLANNVVLQPINPDEFVSVLKEKLANLNLNIPIRNEPKNQEALLGFRNKMLTNTPTLIIVSIILSLPVLGGIFSIAGEDTITVVDLIPIFLTLLVVIVFYASIFAYKTTIGLADTKLIEITKFGNINLGLKEVAYKDIAKIVKTKWRVEIKIKQNNEITFVSNPKEIDVFYSELQNKVSIQKYSSNKYHEH